MKMTDDRLVKVLYAAVCLLLLLLLVLVFHQFGGIIRGGLDQLHEHVGPTALFLMSLAVLSTCEYLWGCQEGDALLRKRARVTAQLCPAVGTIGTLLSVAGGAEMNAALIGHAINSTLWGLGYYVLFCFFTRGEFAEEE